MHRSLFFLFICAALFSCASTAAAQDNYALVNPFIGTTKSSVATKWGGNGGTYPGAVAPSGAIQISPETRITGARGYDYSDHVIYSFSCIKHFSGFPEGSSGHVQLMPVATTAENAAGLSARPFDHQQEEARPGYYKVQLSDDGTIVEATAGVYSGILKMTFPAGQRPMIFIGDAGVLTFPSAKLIYGDKDHAVITVSEPFISRKQVKGGYLLQFRAAEAKNRVIMLRISSSTVSFAGAERNIDHEVHSFDLLQQKTANQWRQQLSTVAVSDTSLARKRIFYTALYHSLLSPWVISDVDGNYRGADKKVYHTSGSRQYGGFSPWDTFRSLHPLWTLLYPAQQQDVILSMLATYRQTGHLPVETMTGNHAVPIITDSWFKGIRGFDPGLAYEAMKKSILNGPFVQDDLPVYHQLGYVPFTRGESVTRTMEYAYDDWALGQYAQLVMHNAKDAQVLQQRGLNYRNLFHAGSLFMLPRSGTAVKTAPGMMGYKEGNKWVYSYFVPHNARDLINLMGGDNQFVNRLDSALQQEVILYDNETVLHLPYLFNAAGRPELTQRWLRKIMLERFGDSPGGLPGNDDLGSMSSAYLFNAMGFYPVSPGKPLYGIGAPLFSSITLHLAGNKSLYITAAAQADSNAYVQSLKMNGKAVEELVLSHELISKGGTMHFVMGAKPGQWPQHPYPAALSETKTAAAISIERYSVSTTTVNPDQQFWIRFELSNTGSTGTKRVTVYQNGKEIAYKSCLVPAGTMRKDSISCRLYATGIFRLGFSEANTTHITVEEPLIPVAHPYFVSQLSLIPLCRLGSPQHISYEVQNLTGRTQQFLIPVSTDDRFHTTDTVSLNPGEKKTVQHSYTVQETGIRTVSVADKVQPYKAYNNNLASMIVGLDMTKMTAKKQIEDMSGLGNHALLKTSTLQQAEPKLPLLGDHSYFEIPNSPAVDQMDTTITMMTWVYPTGSEKGLVDILSKGDHHVLQVNDQKTLAFFAGGWGRGDCTVKLPAGWKQHWHHIAGVCKGNLLRLYIDGVMAGEIVVDGTVNLSAESRWQIGRNEEFPGQRVYHGYIDKVKIYEQPLSAAEIASCYAQERNSLSVVPR